MFCPYVEIVGFTAAAVYFPVVLSKVLASMTWNFIEVTGHFIVAAVNSLWARGRKNRDSIHGRVRRCFSSQESSDQLRFPQFLVFSGYLVISSFGVKRPQHEAGHFRPSVAEVKNWSRCYFTSPNTFMGTTLTVAECVTKEWVFYRSE